MMIDQMIGHYRIIEEIGRGGMGVVYKAHDQKLDRPVALKVLNPDFVGDKEYRHRFVREARSAAAVTHPYIASIYDAGESDGTLFIGMEFVEGRTMRALLKERPIAIPDAQRYATEIAEGLAEAHAAKLVHRDLKPDNVMLASNGHIKILDFGLAKLVEERDRASASQLSNADTATIPLTMEGEILGTPAYMSPEQARGDPVDSRSDIFAFGSTLYEMVTGRPSFQGANRLDTAASLLRDRPTPASQLNPEVPSDLNRIISRCLHKDPVDRYNDTRDLVAAMKDLQETESALNAPSTSSGRRFRGRVAAFSAIGIAALALAVVWALQRGQEPVQSGPIPEPSHSDRPAWVLVAEFDGPADEPDLATGAREYVTAAFERSRSLTPISGPDLKQGLRMAMMSDTTRVTTDVARELALRSRAEVYVAGRIDRMMQEYSIVLRAWDPQSDKLVTSVSAVASNQKDFVVTLEALVDQLRGHLADVLSTSEHSPLAKGPMTGVMTSSLEACVKLHEGRELLWSGENEASLRKLQEALQFDPEFALAWFLVGINYANRGDVDSARTAFDEARSKPERLTDSQRLMIEADYAGIVEGDSGRAIRLFDQLLARDPGYITAYSDRGANLWRLGRYEDALESYRRAREVSPFGAIPLTLNNEFWALLRLDRTAEARQIAAQLSGAYRKDKPLVLAVLEDDWTRATQLAHEILDDPTSTPGHRQSAQDVLASAAARRGAIGAACRVRGGEISSWNILLSVMSRRQKELRSMPVCRDTTIECLSLRATLHAILGDTIAARRDLDWISRKPQRDLRKHDTRIVAAQAWMAAAQNRWERVAGLMEEATPRGRIPIDTDLTIEGRWLAAEAYQSIGRLEEAARHLEDLLLFPGYDRVYAGLCSPFVHHRLVLIYSKLNRTADARRHWETLETTLTQPDPDLLPLIEEARNAVCRLGECG